MFAGMCILEDCKTNAYVIRSGINQHYLKITYLAEAALVRQIIDRFCKDNDVL